MGLVGLASLLTASGRDVEAEPLLDEALRGRRRHQAADHPQVAEAERAPADARARR